MTRAEARDWALALDIVWNCDRAVRFVEGLDIAAFRDSELHQAAVERCITIVGEAASKLSTGFRDSLPDIPWSAITGMRHVVIHNYGRVDLGDDLEDRHALHAGVGGPVASLDPAR